ncbi:hypothetical protein RUM43_010497 [Polyplax serrata]|uniref:Uncharacterized protein n=1 Tax=Polyplax serrata TaxID=468196 RepID=A0AAN8S4W6_POLSC
MFRLHRGFLKLKVPPSCLWKLPMLPHKDFSASDQLLTADLDGQVMAPEAVGFSLMAEDIRRDRVVYEVLHRFHIRPVNFTCPVIHFVYSPIPEQQQ